MRATTVHVGAKAPSPNRSRRMNIIFDFSNYGFLAARQLDGRPNMVQVLLG